MRTQLLSWLSKIVPFNFLSAYYIGLLKEEFLDCSVEYRWRKINWVNLGKYSKEGWFADPFFLRLDSDKAIIFAEEWLYETQIGRLVEVVVDIESAKLISLQPLLQLSTHLSFPIIWREKGRIYVYPENYMSGTLSLWEYDNIEHRLVNPRVLINEPLQDAQLLLLDGKYYIFATKCLTVSTEDDKDLYVYESDDLLGEYREIQVIQNKKKEERGAGNIYIEDGMIIRPAQISNNHYGEGVVLYQLLKNDGKFSEKEINRYYPDTKQRRGRCFHTFNKMGGWCLIDGKDYIFPCIAKIYLWLNRCL